MNQLQKRATLYKLAAIQGAVRYVLRQRYMRKQAEGGLFLGSRRPEGPLDAERYGITSPRVQTTPYGGVSIHGDGERGTYEYQNYPKRRNPSISVQHGQTIPGYGISNLATDVARDVLPNPFKMNPGSVMRSAAKHLTMEGLKRQIPRPSVWQRHQSNQQRLGRQNLTPPEFFTPNPVGQPTTGNPNELPDMYFNNQIDFTPKANEHLPSWQRNASQSPRW